MHFATKKIWTPQRDIASQTAQSIPNTNVISIDLGELATKVDLLAGDASSCVACGAIFNSFSPYLERDGQQVWVCEFCDHSNSLELEGEEFPKANTCDYMLFPAQENQISSDEQTLVFVLDISGSMCVTTELQGKIQLRGKIEKTDDLMREFRAENPNQYLPGQNRNSTFVSRLQCVQAAVESQLSDLQKKYPKSRVGLVCFNGDVTVIGDGSKPPVIITGKKLEEFETLLDCGSQHQMKTSITDAKAVLVNTLYSLEETGPTALGPAVVVAIGMCKDFPGSKIVLATDGLANTGLGAFDDFGSTQEDALSFYTKMANYAKQKGITISVIGIKGDSLNMNTIGKLADITQGDVDIVDPVNITKNFSSILEARLVATEVEVKLFLHKVQHQDTGFMFPKDDRWNVPNNQAKKFQCYASRTIGTAFADTEITCQFSQKDESELSQLFGSNPQEKKHLPFQVQISYTALSGMKCLRVITKTKEITRDFAEVEEDVDVAVLGMHANDLAAQFAQQGNFEEAHVQQQAYGQFLHTKAKTPVERTGFSNWSSHQPEYSALSPAPPPPAPASPGFFNSAFRPKRSAVQSTEQERQQAQQLDDNTANMVIQSRNTRGNQKMWSKERKY